MKSGQYDFPLSDRIRREAVEILESFRNLGSKQILEYF